MSLQERLVDFQSVLDKVKCVLETNRKQLIYTLFITIPCNQYHFFRLQTLSDLLVEKFTSKGLMQRQYDRVKLHATIMNTLFRRDPTGLSKPEFNDRRQDRQNRSRQERESFDATNILRVLRYDHSLIGPT